ncbi:MAG: ATP-binding cassette domain-containing protein, partial [Cyanobacteria bacterium P01_C01_bin.69]
RVFFSLNVVVARLQSLTAFGAGIDRLYEFSESLGEPAEVAPEEDKTEEDKTEADKTEENTPTENAEESELSEMEEAAASAEGEPLIDFQSAPQIAVRALTLQTPNYQRTLIEDLSIELDGEGSLLVMGPSGCGKSSLMRAIAGLWTSGSGTIARPELSDLLFLPQKPYMVLGSLRTQLLYPYFDADITDERLTEVLAKVNLPDLVDRFDGLDAEEEWGDVLSLGEQQRLSLARVLVHEPKYAILDEATSALDRQNEAQLYSYLAAAKTAYISVGHRESLKSYHQSLLRLAVDHSWEVENQEMENQEMENQ